MKIHIAFDMPDLEHALAIAPLVAPYSDCIQIGPILLYQHGITIINAFKQACPNTMILADTKIVDRAKNMISLFSQPNVPDWITVMAGASNRTIHATCSAAHDIRIKGMLNLLDAASMGQSAMEAKNLGADAIVLHQSYDEPDPLSFVDKWDMVKENTSLPVFIATRITRQNIHEIISLRPDGIVYAQTLDAKKPALEAQFFYEICNKN